ncbi:MAG: hypothetical protein ACLPYB_16295 [Desulfobaccales bacterium]
MLIKRLIGIIILAILFVITANAQSQQPTPGPGIKGNPPQIYSPDSQQKAESDKRGTTESPLIVKTINPPKTAAEADQERSYQDEKASQNWWIVRFTGILAAVAILQFLALAFQAWYLRKGFKITEIAANAAKESAEVAETALHISERAYLSIEQIGFVEPLKVGEMPNLKLKIINTGKTPAQIIDTSTNVRFFDKIPSIPVYPPGQKSQSQMTIRPGGKNTLANIRGYTVTTKQFSDMLNGTQKLLIWGRIIYQDIFKHLMVVGFGAEFFVNNFLPVDGYSYIDEYKPDNEQS